MSEVIDIHKKNGRRPEYDVYIGRATRNTEFTEDSKWCNPHFHYLEQYEVYIKKLIEKKPEIYNLNELKGKKLGCWCITTKDIVPEICHGQVLMRLIRVKCINECV